MSMITASKGRPSCDGLACAIESFLAVAGRHHLGTGLAQAEADQLLIGLVIVRQQNTSMKPWRQADGPGQRQVVPAILRAAGTSSISLGSSSGNRQSEGRA